MKLSVSFQYCFSDAIPSLNLSIKRSSAYDQSSDQLAARAERSSKRARKLIVKDLLSSSVKDQECEDQGCQDQGGQDQGGQDQGGQKLGFNDISHTVVADKAVQVKKFLTQLWPTKLYR